MLWVWLQLTVRLKAEVLIVAASIARRNGALIVMQVLSIAELVSLIVILINRLTFHSPAVTSSGGPIHGLLYVSTIVLALLLPFPRSAKWLAVVPGIGGLLALRRAHRIRETTTASRSDTGRVHAQAQLTDEDRSAAAIIVDGATAALSRAVQIGPLSFTVPRGSITGLIGPNGAGKTTALRMICGLVAPATGAISVIAHRPSTDNSSHAFTPIGVLIDSPGFIPGLTARANLLALTRLADWPPALVPQALERVGLAAAADRRVSSFSLGMKQRLGLAAALLGQPEVVILDEPTNGLDPRGTIELREFLHSLASDGITVIIASHALDQIEELCDHIVAIHRGLVVYNGAPDQMIEGRPNGVRCGTVDSTALSVAVDAFTRDGLSVQPVDDHTVFVLGDAHVGVRVNRLASEAGVLLSEISPVRPTLNEAFLALTSNDETLQSTLTGELNLTAVDR